MRITEGREGCTSAKAPVRQHGYAHAKEISKLWLRGRLERTRSHILELEAVPEIDGTERAGIRLHVVFRLRGGLVGQDWFGSSRWPSPF